MVYYLYNDEDKKLIGIDKTTCSALSMNFLEGQINDITFLLLLLVTFTLKKIYQKMNEH